jgi:secreted PhoX family phosphatase
MNHEFGNTAGAIRAHGSKGAFVSKWVINKSDLSVVSGADLIQNVKLWNGTSYTTYNAGNPSTLAAFNRFCSADLPAVSAYYNSATGLGTQARIFMNGEEAGDNGRMLGHIVTGTEAGTTYELPHLGKFSAENLIASPAAQDKTIVAGMDDSTPGQVYMYVGTKTNTGNEVDKAGLTNGKLYGVAVTGLVTETSASTPAANTAFTLIDIGTIRDSSGTYINTKSNSLGVTTFLRPEDGAWDPKNPNDFYFATTNAFASPSRLWRLRFNNITTPETGGTITAVLDGTEGQKMLDNLTIDSSGHILLVEDVGGNIHNGKIWQYNIGTDKLMQVGQHDSSRFVTAGSGLLTIDEEASGILDVQNILGAGKFLVVDQAHYPVAGAQVEGGQLLTLFNPDSYNGAFGALPSSSQTPYLTPVAQGVVANAILTSGDQVGSYKMAGTPDGLGAFDNGDGTFTLLMNHEFGNTSGGIRAHGSKGAFVSKWVINKTTLAVTSGADLIQNVKLWNGTSYTTYNTGNPSTLAAFNRFCSADLPAVSAYYNSATGQGTQSRIFMNGEEAGDNGRMFGHIVTGTEAGITYELPHLGKFSAENLVASPTPQDKTIVAGLDDSTPGQVYMYVGTKTNTGTEVNKAGLTNGKLYGVAVTGLITETSAGIPAANTAFTLVDIGNIRDSSGTYINTRSNTLGVTTFLRPEDGSWDPSNPNDFYFATTNAFASPSRLWKLHFTNIATPELGGTITAVLDGTEGQKMLDNLTIDNSGHILLVEDVGNNAHIGKTWQYNIATDAMTMIAKHDSTRFLTGAPNFLTQDEEASGILDAQAILGPGKFLIVDQAHYAVAGDQVEGGQLLTLYNPESFSSNPEIAVQGNSVNIADDDMLPTLADNTNFGDLATSVASKQNLLYPERWSRKPESGKHHVYRYKCK